MKLWVQMKMKFLFFSFTLVWPWALISAENSCLNDELHRPQCAAPVFVDEGIFLLLTPNNTQDLDDNE